MVCALLALMVVVAVVAMVGVVLVVVVRVVAWAVREIGAFAAVMVITASGAVVGIGAPVGRLGTEGPDCPAASGGVSTMYGMFTGGGSGPTGGLSGAPTVVIGAGTVTAGALPAEELLDRKSVV